MKKPLKISIAVKIFLGFLFLLFTFVSVDLWSIYRLRQIGTQLKMLNRYQRLTSLTSRLEALKLNKKADLFRLYHSPLSQLNEELYQRLKFPPFILRMLAKHLKLLHTLPHNIPHNDLYFLFKLKERLKRLQTLLQNYERKLNALFFALPKNSSRQKLLHDFQQTERALGREVQLLALQMDFRLTQTVLLAEREEHRSIWELLLMSLLTLFVGLVILAFSSIPLKKIQILAQRTQEIAQGETVSPLNLPPTDEIGELAQAFDVMTIELQKREENLAQKRRELEEAYEDLKKSSRKLLRSERLAVIGRLAAQITHEIRNPLNAISLNLELLEEDLLQLPDPEESLLILRAAMEELERLVQITEEYLRFARLPPPQLEPSNITQLLESLMNFLAEELLSQSIRWKLELDPHPPQVNIDQRQLRQALLNLIRNAMEAASQNTSQPLIEIKTIAKHDGIEIIIKDNGPGMEEEIRERIFDPFFSTKEGGSGLGLPLTQQIITGHGGTISCLSQKNQGTSFIIFLPKAS